MKTYGPANDASEAVRIEIRAAEIAASGIRGIKLWGEVDGWCMYSRRYIAGAHMNKHTPSKRGEWAGYLACCIARTK